MFEGEPDQHVEPHDTTGSTRHSQVNRFTPDAYLKGFELGRSSSPNRHDFSRLSLASTEVLQQSEIQFPSTSGSSSQYPQEVSLPDWLSAPPLNTRDRQDFGHVDHSPRDRVAPSERLQWLLRAEPFDLVGSVPLQRTDRAAGDVVGRLEQRHRERRSTCNDDMDVNRSERNDALSHEQPRTESTDTPLESFGNGSDAEMSTIRPTSSLGRVDLTAVSRRPDGEDRENCGGSSTAFSSSFKTTNNVSVEDEGLGRLRTTGIGFLGHKEDLPLASRTSEAIFTEIQLELESLLLELRSFEEDVRDSLSVTGSASSENLEAEEPFDGHGNGSGSRQSSGETPRSTGAGDQEHHGSGRKRPRSENGNNEHGNDNRSRAAAKRPQQDSTSESEQMYLICCFKHESHDSCPGTDKHICEVIKTLSITHKIHICRTCFVRLGDDCRYDMHQSPACVKHCLSADCKGNPTPASIQRHRYVQDPCSKRSKQRLEDSYRYIFRLVHPDPATHPQPENVFMPEEKHHNGVRLRARRGLNRTELLAQADALTAQVEEFRRQVEELRRQDAENKTRIEVLTRDLEAERANRIGDLTRDLDAERRTTTHLRNKMQKLRDITNDALLPGMAGDSASVPSQAFHTPPESSQPSQRSSVIPTSNDTRTTRQDQLAGNVGLHHFDNYAASDTQFSGYQGNNASSDLMPGADVYTHASAATQYDSSAFTNSLGNLHDTTTNLEFAMDPKSAGTGGDTPLGSNGYQSNPHHQFDPHLQSHQNHFNQNQLNDLHQSQPQFSIPDQFNPFHFDSDQLNRNPNQFNADQWARETPNGDISGLQDHDPFTTHDNWLPESSSQDIGSTSMQWHPPAPLGQY